MNFNQKYEIIRQLVQPELNIIEEKIVSQIDVREPLNKYIKDFIKMPSKRIRSVLALLFLKAMEEKITPEHFDLLAAVEIIHTASLFHDDVIDESCLRRGHKTLSAEFDNRLAIIAGDYLLSRAMRLLLHIPIESRVIIEDFLKTIDVMCIGEINQNFDRFKIGTIEEYIERISNKTARLFEVTFFWTSEILTKCYGKTSSCCGYKFARDFGIAFQIRDDLLNLTCGDPLKPNKNDITDGIYTAPVIFAQSVEKYQAGIEKTKDLLNNYIESAKNYLSGLSKNEYKDALFELLELLQNE